MNTSAVACRRLLRLALASLSAIALLFVGVWGGTAASANPYPPTDGCGIVARQANVTPGETVTITGSGFASNTAVSLTIHSTATSLGGTHTDGTGAFQDRITLPVTGLAAGTHLIEATGSNETCSLTMNVQTHGVDAAQATKTTHDGGTGGLAFTGVEVASMATIAALLLGGGLLLLLIGRRRKA